MKKKKRGSKSVDERFFEFQRNFYKTLKDFINEGDELQSGPKKRGAIAPTEVLMFLLFWNVLRAKFTEAQLDFVYAMFVKVMDENWMEGKLVDPPEMGPKKGDTIH